MVSPRVRRKLDESTRIDIRDRRKNGMTVREEEGRGGRMNPCYLEPTIAVGSHHRKTREGPTPRGVPLPLARAYIPSESPPHHDHPQAVLFSPSRGIEPSLSPHFFPVVLLIPRDSSSFGEERSDQQGQIETHTLSLGGRKGRLRERQRPVTKDAERKIVKTRSSGREREGRESGVRVRERERTRQRWTTENAESTMRLERG